MSKCEFIIMDNKNSKNLYIHVNKNKKSRWLLNSRNCSHAKPAHPRSSSIHPSQLYNVMHPRGWRTCGARDLVNVHWYPWEPVMRWWPRLPTLGKVVTGAGGCTFSLGGWYGSTGPPIAFVNTSNMLPLDEPALMRVDLWEPKCSDVSTRLRILDVLRRGIFFPATRFWRRLQKLHMLSRDTLNGYNYELNKSMFCSKRELHFKGKRVILNIILLTLFRFHFQSCFDQTIIFHSISFFLYILYLNFFTAFKNSKNIHIFAYLIV